MSVVKRVPKTHLSDADAHAIISPFHEDEQGLINWREFLSSSAHSVRSCLKETFLRRRINLFALSDDSNEGRDVKKADKEGAKLKETAMLAMKALAEKLVDVCKVKKVAETYFVALPDDVAAKVRPSSGHKTVENATGRSIRLLKQEVNIPMVATTFFQGVKPNMAHHVLSSKRAQLQKYKAIVRINAVEVDASQEKALEAKISLASDANEVATISLSLRLPSIALADKDVAEEFSRNLTDRIYCEFTDAANYSTFKFKVVADHH